MSIWTTVNEYIDIETGELISKHKIQQKDYRIVNKIKNIIQNEQQTGRIVKITNECKRNKWRQSNLFN